MKLVAIMAAILALACAAAAMESGHVPWITLCGHCRGRSGCLKCINDVYGSGNIGLAWQCINCVYNANPGTCYKCITNIPFRDDGVQHATQCLSCASQGHCD